MLAKMENKRIKKRNGFLPRFFKKIGFIVIVLAFVPPVVVKSMNLHMLQSQKDLFRLFTFNVFILGLLFIALSKDKVEDEMIFDIRLKSMAFSFISVVFYVIIHPLSDLLFKVPIQDVTGQDAVITMLFSYLIMFYLQKIGR